MTYARAFACLTLLLGCSSAEEGAPSGGAGTTATDGGAGAGMGGGAGTGAAATAGTANAGGVGGPSGNGGAVTAGTGGTGGASGGGAATCTVGTGTEVVAGALLDQATCLMWEAEPGFIAGGNWEPARDYCDALSLGGYDDWRMPTVAELASTPVMFTGRLATSPRYLPDGSSDLANFHYCGIVHWDAAQPRACGWVGPANTDGTICVRGAAAVTLAEPDACCPERDGAYMPASQ